MNKMNVNKRILIVEDDSSMGFLLADFLGTAGFDVRLATTGNQGLSLFLEEHFDLCIFDIMMPEMDGFTLARNVKKANMSIPFIFLTARGLKQDKIKGFSLGADDYITKPFDEEELLCRINAVLNRTGAASGEIHSTIAVIGKYTFNWENQILQFEGDQVKRLTKKESEILKFLCVNKGKLLKREDILIALWGENDYFHGRSLDVFIAKLRKYLSNDDRVKIENVPSVGFIFNVEA